MKSTTLADIAAFAGTSSATVSYYFSGKKRISGKTAAKILEGAKKLNYKPLHTRCRAEKSKIINMCLSLETRDISDKVYHLGLMNGIMDCLAENGCQFMFSRLVYDDAESHNAFLTSLDVADGIILCNPRKDHRFEDEFRERNIPFVILGSPEKNDSVFYVDVDMQGIGFQAADYFLAKGSQKNLYLNLPETMTQSQHRLQGFRLAYEQRGFVFPEKDHFYAPTTENEVFDLVIQLLKTGEYSAAVTASEGLAHHVIKAARELNIEIPEKLELLSMGGSVLGTCTVPSLTVIDFNSHKHGYEAARLLMDILERKRVTPFHMILPGNLVERESTRRGIHAVM